MRESLCEYIQSFGKWVWAVVIDYIFGAVGVYQTITSVTTLSRIGWGIIFVLAFTIPPFIAFHLLRLQRDKLIQKVNETQLNDPIVLKAQEKHLENVKAELEQYNQHFMPIAIECRPHYRDYPYQDFDMLQKHMPDSEFGRK
jgi:hypothetical protein